MSEAKLQELVQRWRDQRDKGDPPSSEELCRDCPELLPALRQRLDAEAQTEQVNDTPTRRDPLILDPTGRADAELADTLRRRLRLVAVIYLVQWAIYLGIASGPDERPESYLMVAVECSVLSSCVLLTTFRQGWRLQFLRGLEALLFGTICTRITLGQTLFLASDILPAIVGEPDHLKLILLGDALLIAWICLILVYGVFVPNTGTRSAIVVVSMALIAPLLFGGFAYDAGLLGHPWVHHALKRMCTHLGVAAVIAIFSSYGVDRLRREVRAARQLGQYVLKRRLAAGGMGEVYLAEHQLLRRLCAVKVIRAEKAASQFIRQRFEREAQVMASLRHANIVDVFDYGVTPDGTFFYVMEYLAGQTLRELVESSGPLPAAQAIAYLRQITAAVGVAHQRGLIHRDIKPSNAIVIAGDAGATVKLLDFGLVSGSLAEDGRPLTQDGRLVGTPAFMSPEQIAGLQSLDARSDIYSIGVVAVFLLTGRNPFERPEVRQVFAAHLHESLPALNISNVALEAVVRRCLEKNPADRFADAAALERALVACVQAA